MFDRIYEIENERLIDCAFYTGDFDKECEVCGDVYPERLSRWRAPHEKITHAWVCCEECAREWCDINWETLEEIDDENT